MISDKLIHNIIRIFFVFLIIEILSFGIWFYTLPSINEQAINVIAHHKNGLGYSTEDDEIELDTTFSAISSLSILNQSIDNEELNSLVMQRYDTDSGLFFEEEKTEISIEATYFGVGILSKTDSLDLIDTKLTIKSVNLLRTDNGLFRDVDELDPVHLANGELDHLFEAVSIFDKLYTNQTQFYLEINRTKIAHAISNLQNNDGGMSEGIVHPASNMRSAYHTVSIISKLNSSISFFEQFGFDSLNLLKWIESMYNEDTGFSMNANSQATIESTAYASITLSRLGISSNEILGRFEDGIKIMINEFNGVVQDDEESNLIDIIHDVLLALKRIDQLIHLERTYLPPIFDFLIRLFAFVSFIFGSISFTLKIYLILNEDESKYYEYQLKQGISRIFDDYKEGIVFVSELLQDDIQEAAIINHVNSNLATLRAITSEFEYLIVFDEDTFDIDRISKLSHNQTEMLVEIDFSYSLTIDEGKKLISDIKS